MFNLDSFHSNRSTSYDSSLERVVEFFSGRTVDRRLPIQRPGEHKPARVYAGIKPESQGWESRIITFALLGQPFTCLKIYIFCYIKYIVTTQEENGLRRFLRILEKLYGEKMECFNRPSLNLGVGGSNK